MSPLSQPLNIFKTVSLWRQSSCISIIYFSMVNQFSKFVKIYGSPGGICSECYNLSRNTEIVNIFEIRYMHNFKFYVEWTSGSTEYLRSQKHCAAMPWFLGVVLVSCLNITLLTIFKCIALGWHHMPWPAVSFWYLAAMFCLIVSVLFVPNN